jgi:uncharacterized protein (TIGR03083 family)
MTTDAELVDQLEAVWTSMAALGETLSEEEWKRQTDVPGWSVQDNLVHISGMEIGLLGRELPEHSVPDDLPHVKNDMGRRNEEVVDSRRELSGADALAEFREVTGARVAQLRAYGPGDFAAASWTPAGEGAVRDLLPFRTFDSWVHEQDMRRAVDRPGHFDSNAAAAAFERVVTPMGFVVGKKAGAPDGSSVVFDLDGPLGRTFAIGVDGKRANQLDEVPADPTVRISTDTQTFLRLGCGRCDPGAAFAAGTVRIAGDDLPGGRVVVSLNFLF